MAVLRANALATRVVVTWRQPVLSLKRYRHTVNRYCHTLIWYCYTLELVLACYQPVLMRRMVVCGSRADGGGDCGESYVRWLICRRRSCMPLYVSPYMSALICQPLYIYVCADIRRGCHCWI